MHDLACLPPLACNAAPASSGQCSHLNTSFAGGQLAWASWLALVQTSPSMSTDTTTIQSPRLPSSSMEVPNLHWSQLLHRSLADS